MHGAQSWFTDMKQYNNTAPKVWFALGFILLLWSACTAEPKLSVEEDSSYIVVPLSGTSFNQDATHYEDYIADVTMLVFPSGRSERIAYTRVAHPSGDVTQIPSTKVATGFNDLYFFANIEEQQLQGLLTRDQVEEFLYKQQQEELDFRTKGFPMARVYRAKNILQAAEDAPFAFRPNEEGDTPFAPICRFPISQLQTKDIAEKVALLRPYAKLSVELTGEGAKDIDKVVCYNVAKSYSLAQRLDGSDYPLSAEALPFVLDEETPSGNRVGHIYIPEKLFAHQPSWSEAQDRSGITYVQLTTKGGRTLLVPIAHNAEEALQGGNYLPYVTGKEEGKDGVKPNYNVVRNMNYILRVNVSPDAQNIDLSLQVMPWNLVESEFSYRRPVYSIEVQTSTQSSIALSELGRELELHDNRDCATIHFSISEPKGALWTASITNALSYTLEGTTSGIVGEGTQTYTMTIKPKAKFNKTPQYVQFYVTVNGREIYLGDLKTLPSADGKGRFIDEVPQANKRWTFKQVE